MSKSSFGGMTSVQTPKSARNVNDSNENNMILQCLNQKMNVPVNFQILQEVNNEKKYHGLILNPKQTSLLKGTTFKGHISSTLFDMNTPWLIGWGGNWILLTSHTTEMVSCKLLSG